MAVDAKKYLDYVGLAYYDEKIKEYIKTNGSDVTDKLVALIGAAEKGDKRCILAHDLYVRRICDYMSKFSCFS